MRIETRVSLPADVAEDFLKLYRKAFEPLEVLAAARQSLTDEEFLEEMQHPGVRKWIVWDSFDNPCAMAFMTTDLSLVPWVSLPYYQAKFPEHYERGAIWYFGSILVHPDHQGSSVAVDLMHHLIREVVEADAIPMFDCCGFNVDVKKLPQMIEGLARQICVEVDAQEIDVQRYYAYTFRGLK